MRTFLYSLAAASILVAGCGKDEADFNDLDGQVGVVPGNFNMRLAQVYREQVDGLESKINNVVPGLTASLTQKFADSSDATDEQGTKLSDLLAVKLPGTESELINQRVFKEISNLQGDDGNYFDLVDTQKFLGKSLAGKDYQLLYTPAGDTNFEQQYYLDMISWGQGMTTVTNPQLATAAPVVVAVLDTGVYAEHEDLTGVMWQNVSGAVGYDATTETALAKSESSDTNGHGTHVAGIIGAQGGNAKGIHGVGYLPGRGGNAAQSVTEIMAVKVLNDQGSGTSDMISNGIKWAVDQHRAQKTSQAATRSKQKLIINMSLGGPFEAADYDFKKDAAGKYIFEDDLFNWATSQGDVLIVVAAGNESCGISGKCDLYGQTFEEAYYYPCSYKNVLCVAATTHEDKLAGFSNRKSSVGIAAPGYQIASTLPASKDSYGYYSGTSQATPVTAGAAAVVWSLYSDFSAADLKKILQKSAAKVSAITEEVESQDGRLDLKAALSYAEQLKSGGLKPDAAEPAAGTVASAPTTPTTNPPGGDIDPDAPSENAKAGSGPADKGDGSANGCAVVKGTASTNGLLLLALLLPAAIGLGVRRPQLSRLRSSRARS